MTREVVHVYVELRSKPLKLHFFRCELLSNAFMMMMMREEHSRKSAAFAAANRVTNDVPFIHPLRITSRVRQAGRPLSSFTRSRAKLQDYVLCLDGIFDS